MCNKLKKSVHGYEEKLADKRQNVAKNLEEKQR